MKWITEYLHCQYIDHNGGVHDFFGLDCWARAVAFKARYETHVEEPQDDT